MQAKFSPAEPCAAARRSRAPLIRRFVGVAGVVAGLLVVPAGARAADRTATPSTFASVWSAAQGGDRILLASGSYGNFAGGTKSSPVTVIAQAGASVTMSIDFNGASNIRVDGTTITKLDMQGQTRNITIANSKFTGQAVVRSDEMNNANIVFDHNTHANINVCTNCFEGRLEVEGGDDPTGVTIENSTFGPGGDMDGIQIGARGVQVLNNEFTGIKWISEVHTDSLQLYGSSDTVIRGNYFHDFSTAIMAPDGGQNAQQGCRPGASLGDQDGQPVQQQIGRAWRTCGRRG